MEDMDKRTMRARTMKEDIERELALLELRGNQLQKTHQIEESMEQEYNKTRGRLAQLFVVAHAHLTPD